MSFINILGDVLGHFCHDPLGPGGYHAFMISSVYRPSVWVRFVLGPKRFGSDSSWVRKGLGPSRPRNFGSESSWVRVV